MLQEGEGPYPAGIYCLRYDKEGRYQKDKFHITTTVDTSYQEVKQDLSDLSSGKMTPALLLEREKKRKRI